MTHIPLSRVKPNGHVDIWDLGPQVEPKPPEAPKAPDSNKLKDADLAVAQMEHEDALEVYKRKLREYAAARRAHLDWTETNGGPIKISQWGADARHSMTVEPDRYKIDLPKGMKPGKAQIEAEERAKVEAEELEHARNRDPQFGTGAAA